MSLGYKRGYTPGYTRAAAALAMMIFGGVATSGRTVLEGVFTEAQAARGQAAFRANCVRCHAENLLGQGTAPLAGAAFMERWREDGLDTIFEDMSTRMPNDNPGTLPKNTYLDILTYVLRFNTFPVGAAELTVDTLPNTLLVGKGGPRPVPSNTSVAAVGCLTQAGANFALTSAPEPARTKDEENTTPEEKKVSAARPLGTLSFKLQTSTRTPVDFSFDTLKGQKVLAKGVLIREEGNDRIRITSMESLAPSCAP